MSLRSDRSRNGSLSFEEVYEQFYAKVFNFVYMRMLHREDAEDITEETFFKAMKTYETYDPAKASHITWLCTIAKNLMIDHKRRSHSDKIVSFDESFEVGAEDIELEGLLEDTERRVAAILSHLRPEEREILSLRYTQEMEYAQIGEILGIEPKTAAKRVERLLKKCKEIDGGS